MREVSVSETFCTIMSMLTWASATVVKIWAARPGSSGTPTTVILASLASWATPAMIGSSMVSVPSVSGGRTHVPSFEEKEERTWMGISKRRAYSTHRRWRILAPLAAISSISSWEMRSILCAVETMRGSAVKIPSTSV